MRCINKNLLNDEECCVCFEPKSQVKSVPCFSCQIPLCVKCLNKLEEKKCPCCKYYLEIMNVYSHL